VIGQLLHTISILIFLSKIKRRRPRAATREPGKPQPPARHTPATYKSPPASATAMQSPASEHERSSDRYVVRLSGALAALLGRAEGAELSEDELLGRLRGWGLITYPSPLLEGLLEKLPEVLAAEVLPRLRHADLALCGRVGPALRAAVVSSGLPRAGESGGELLKIEDFVGSVERLAWAKANDCWWDERTCAIVAGGGRLEVLRWARAYDCPWDESLDIPEHDCCARAAEGGHLDVLGWLRDHHCPWDSWTSTAAARNGHLEVLQWAWEGDCPWDAWTCASAASGGHLEVLKWLREPGAGLAGLDGLGCPWDEKTCSFAAAGGKLELLKWAREQDCPWDEMTRHHAKLNGHLELLQWAVEHGAPAVPS